MAKLFAPRSAGICKIGFKSVARHPTGQEVWVDRVIQIHVIKQLVLATPHSHEFHFPVTEPRSSGSAVSNFHVVAEAFIMGSKLRSKPDFNLVQLKLARVVGNAVDPYRVKEEGIGAMHRGISKQEHVGLDASDQVGAVLLTTLEDVDRLTHIPLPVNSIDDAINASFLWEK